MSRDWRLLLTAALQALMWICAVVWYRLGPARMRRADADFVNNYMPGLQEMAVFFAALICGAFTFLVLGWIWLRPKR